MMRALFVGVAFLLPLLAVAEEWTEHTVDGDYLSANRVFATDVDGDGDTDVVGAAFLFGNIVWWENVDGGGLIWAEHTVDGDFSGANSVFARDIDGDGDIDILGAAYQADEITWWENLNGTGLNWSEHTVDDDFNGSNSVFAKDMDGDGDMDVLGAGNNEYITWWENLDGIGQIWSIHTVTTIYDGEFSVFATDVDGDGHIDVLGAARWIDRIAWWKNLDGTGLNWSMRTVNSSFHGATSVFATDLDGDGDIDILGTAVYDGIAWWENLNGSGSSWAEHTLDSEICAVGVFSSDMDSDGDKDILVATGNNGVITWWENADGSGLLWVEHFVNTDFHDTRSVFAADVDGDGDVDVLGASHNTNEITWWEHVRPIEVSLIPLNYPTYIPSAGGPLWYSIELTNSTNSIVQGVLTTEVVLPNGNVFGPILSFNLGIGIDQTLSSPLLQLDVPGFVPSGMYEYHATFSPFTPYPPVSNACFEFVKLMAPSTEPVVNQWGYTSWTELEKVTPSNDEIPSEFTISKVYPNPFNASTTIDISLPETSQLSAKVYNVVGQQVALLADGEFNPGMHKLTFDAKDLASGLYFVRVIAPGTLHHVQKVILVR